MRRFIFLSLVLVLALGLAFVSCSSSSDNNTDGDTSDGDTDSSKLQLGDSCTDDLECESRLCYPHSSGSFCTLVCATDAECFNEMPGACCKPVTESQNLCLRPDRCDGTDGDTSEPDKPCAEPDKKMCMDGKSVYQCNGDSMLWVFQNTCAEDEICQIGECYKAVADGDQDTIEADTESDTEWTCGDPANPPGAILKFAEDLFDPDNSNPIDNASVYPIDGVVHADFLDNKYVRLELIGRSSGPLDDNDKVQELTFFLDIGRTYEYKIQLDYVCGPNWGQAALYIDDQTEPVLRVEEATPREFVDLNCSISGSEEKPLPKIRYETICLERGAHKLRVRVDGHDPNADDYTIGLDYIKVLPNFDYGRED